MLFTARLPLLCLLAALFAAPADASGLAFVVNSRSASVSVIDMTTLVELRRVPLLREPHHLVLSPDGKYLLVGDTVGNAMFFLDPGLAKSNNAWQSLTRISWGSAQTGSGWW